MLALLSTVGMAVGVSAYLAYPQEGQPEKKDDPPAQSPNGQDPEEVQRLLKRLQEEAAKHGVSPTAVTPQPEAPAPANPTIPRPQPGVKTAPEAAKGMQPATKKDMGGKGGGSAADPKSGGRSVRPANGTEPGRGPTFNPQPQPAAGGPKAMQGQPQPAAAGAAGAGAPAVPIELPPMDTAWEDDGKSFLFNFTDETELRAIVEFVQKALNLQIIATDSGLVGQKIVLLTPIRVSKEQILPFLTSLLESKGYTMVRDARDIYIITPVTQIPVTPGNDPNNSTRVIPTPGLKPSSIQGPITTLINANRAAGAAGGAAQPIFMDDLGVVILTDTPNNIAMVEAIVKTLVDEQNRIGITRFPVVNIAASSARDRIIELLSSGIISRPGGAPAPNQAAIAQGASGSISNIPDRVTLDPSTNALLFRGRPDETALLFRLLQLVDVPNQLDARWYPIGSRAAETVVDAARQLQLGEVRYFESGDTGTGLGAGTALGTRGRTNQPNVAGLQQTSDVTGAGFVVYPEQGGFIYRGTTQQHARVERLIKDLGPLSEFDDTITYEFIKLKHSKATDLAQTVMDLLNDSTSSGNRGALLGGRLGQGSRRDTATSRTQELQRRAAGENPQQPAAAPGEVMEISGEDVHVLADEPTNQVLVKAPKRLQPQLKVLINKLDLRRPQVFIEAKIVAITTSDDFRLSAEVQQVIGQYALNTNFGLGTIGAADAAGSLLAPKTPATNLSGLTTALIRSKDVPFIINTIQRNTDSRILASPQVLVDDNEEATVESLDQQPTLTTTLGSGTSSNNTTQSFGGFEPAGPRLTVKPQISEGGYMKLEYEIELSSFTGDSTVAGVPPPKQENRVRADSVTVPSDTTIVVGGLNLEQVNNTVSGIPLLMNIPLVGELFKDTRKNTRNVTLYVFITPKIMRDPSFADLRLLTTKPLSESRLSQELPPPLHERIDVIDSARLDTRDKMDERIEEQNKEFQIIDPREKPNRRRRETGPMYDG